MENRTISILGIHFFKGSAKDVVQYLKFGGLLVVPAAPALVNINKDTSYYHSLKVADIVIPDSSYMTLIWNFFNKEKVQKISGLLFLKTFLSDLEVINESRIFLINPGKDESKSNLSYLNSRGFSLVDANSYTAPIYNQSAIEDPTLLRIIEMQKPKFILINLGGGVQEKLGAYLKQSLSYRPAIICTGAAIAFLTGHQIKIPAWADKFYLGWLFRCIEKPKLYIPRYLKGFKLFRLLVNYGKYSPIQAELK